MTDSLAHWLKTLESRHPKDIDLGLERCSRVFKEMGSPLPAPLVFTVAGTNGKGSVVAYLSVILGSFGLRCGSYTSPHLLQFNERVQIAATQVSDEDLVAAFEKVEQARKDVSLTYFEFTTLAAFQLMNEAGLDAAILEVGLGGRLDTVNLIDADCTVITTIGLDHQDYLGHDRESIGAEKAGIMRSNIPVVCGDRQAPESIIARARELGSELFILGRDFDWSMTSAGLSLEIGTQSVQTPTLAMSGRHQQDNLATAVTAVHCMFPRELVKGKEWKMAVGKLCLPGRLASVAGDQRFVVDVGHNPLAASVVAQYLALRSARKVFCVLGMFKDKDVPEVARLLHAGVDSWLCAGLGGLRGQSGVELAKKISTSLSHADVSAFETVAAAVDEAGCRAQASDLVLVFGSFETASAAISQLEGIDR